MIKRLIGACSGHKDPDLWYPELPHGRPSKKTKKLIVKRVTEARAICNGCTVKQECLTRGMETKDLAHGMWGGMLAGERIELAISMNIEYKSTPCLIKGDPRSESGFVRGDEEENVMLFLKKVREWSANI